MLDLLTGRTYKQTLLKMLMNGEKHAKEMHYHQRTIENKENFLIFFLFITNAIFFVCITY